LTSSTHTHTHTINSETNFTYKYTYTYAHAHIPRFKQIPLQLDIKYAKTTSKDTQYAYIYAYTHAYARVLQLTQTPIQLDVKYAKATSSWKGGGGGEVHNITHTFQRRDNTISEASMQEEGVVGVDGGRGEEDGMGERRWGKGMWRGVSTDLVICRMEQEGQVLSAHEHMRSECHTPTHIYT